VSAVTFGYELILSRSIEDFFKLNFIEKELIPVQSAVMDETMIITTLQDQTQNILVSTKYAF
jgi:hypothetical protein